MQTRLSLIAGFLAFACAATPPLHAQQKMTSPPPDLSSFTQSIDAARKSVIAASLTLPRDDALIDSSIQALKDAELAFVHVRAANHSFTLNPPRNVRQATPPIPGMTSAQVATLTQMAGTLAEPTRNLAAARTALNATPFTDTAAVTAALNSLATAERTLADTRADALAHIQASPNALSTPQITALIANGGALTSGGFNEPQPLDFNDHEGYTSLFDGTLKGWDGNPKFWRAENNTLIGESTPQNPSGNTYIAYRTIEAKDFTLKFEMKTEGTGGSGMQYRSKTGIPWLTPIPPNVTANAGPLNLNWMMTGPQADFWPAKIYTGQFYSENTPMRIMAYRGQVVEGAGMAPRRLMANIGDRVELGKLVHPDDWNQYTVIARGGTFIHIVNGQLMAVMIDDDPTSSNNQSGLIGIEIEATTKVSVRNIWLKKLN